MALLKPPTPTCTVSASNVFVACLREAWRSAEPRALIFPMQEVSRVNVSCHHPQGCLLTSGPSSSLQRVEGGSCLPLGRLPSPSPTYMGQTPVPGGRVDQQEGGPSRKEGSHRRVPWLCPLAWKWNWLESRFSSNSEANATMLQPYPLTEDGKVRADLTLLVLLSSLLLISPSSSCNLPVSMAGRLKPPLGFHVKRK